MLRKLLEPVNGLTHLYAALATVVGLILLVYLGWRSPTKIAALRVYGVPLILMFSASAVYHLVNAGPRIMLFLRKLDHSSIYLLIAGTYTPICLYYFTGFWRWGPLAVIWSLAHSLVLFLASINRAIADPEAPLEIEDMHWAVNLAIQRATDRAKHLEDKGGEGEESV